ncbi:MAG: Cmr1-1 Cmr subunit domain-containing protein [Candidatus Hydrothermia bacterium]
MIQRAKIKDPIEKSHTPERAIFGLPIVSVKKFRDLRKASPLMFKIIEISQSNYVLIFIIYKPKSNQDFIFHPEIKSVNWDLISDFLQGKQKIYPKEVKHA